MACPGEAFAERIHQQEDDRDRHQLNAQRVQVERRPKQKRETGGGYPKHGSRGECAAGKRPARGARIARVDLAIEKTVRGHGCGPRADDGERDPAQHRRRRNPSSR
jgi:hypothetical protein